MQWSQRARQVLDPVAEVVASGLARLGYAGPTSVDVGVIQGFHALDGDTLVLSEGLLGPGVHHPDEVGSDLGLDRWRRAAASVLEASVLASLPAGPAWLRSGVAIRRVAAAVPELRLDAPDLWLAGRGDLVAHPRAGVAVVDAWEEIAGDGLERAMACLRSGQVGSKDFLDAVRWMAGEGLSRRAPTVERPPAVEVPVELSPWSWARVKVPANACGGRLRSRGRGGVSPTWARADAPLEAVAAACDAGATVQLEPGGPIGSWELRSAEGFGDVMGARGLVFQFREGGRFEAILADAFVGRVADVATAARVGTSGTVRGRWSVDGPWQIMLHDITPMGVTVHGRDASPFLMPADGFGLGEQLRAMQGSPWTWSVEDDRLQLVGHLYGGVVTVRFVAAP